MAITRFFRTLKDGEPMTIALSRDAAWRSLDTFWGYKEEERARWSVQEEERDITTVDGVVVYGWGLDGSPRPHVLWTCPKCGEEHVTDLDPGESNPAIWFCERGRAADVFLVSWRRENGS